MKKRNNVAFLIYQNEVCLGDPAALSLFFKHPKPQQFLVTKVSSISNWIIEIIVHVLENLNGLSPCIFRTSLILHDLPELICKLFPAKPSILF